MKKIETEVVRSWFTLAVNNPRAAISVGAGIIIVILGYVIITLNGEKNTLNHNLLQQEVVCTKDKLDLINAYILRQQELNDRYTRKIEDLYEKINDINKHIR
jgi:hypothetical protein